MSLYRPIRAAYSWRPGFIYFPPLGRIQRRDSISLLKAELLRRILVVLSNGQVQVL
jgi:hypothetical protein